MKVIAKEEMVNTVGTQLEPSEWVVLDQARINTFADCTEDHQFIHIDEEKAAQTPFGGTIAHGFLTLSMMAKFTEDSMIVPEGMVMGMNYGCDKLRFDLLPDFQVVRANDAAVERGAENRRHAAAGQQRIHIGLFIA